VSELLVRPEAELDAFEAAAWYERERQELGTTFLKDLGRTFGRIQRRPLQFPLVTADVRRALLGGFPFGVFFFVEDDASTVIAVMHLHRHPSSWEARR